MNQNWKAQIPILTLANSLDEQEKQLKTNPLSSPQQETKEFPVGYHEDYKLARIVKYWALGVLGNSRFDLDFLVNYGGGKV